MSILFSNKPSSRRYSNVLQPTTSTNLTTAADTDFSMPLGSFDDLNDTCQAALPKVQTMLLVLIVNVMATREHGGLAWQFLLLYCWCSRLLIIDQRRHFFKQSTNIRLAGVGTSALFSFIGFMCNCFYSGKGYHKNEHDALRAILSLFLFVCVCVDLRLVALDYKNNNSSSGDAAGSDVEGIAVELESATGDESRASLSRKTKPRSKWSRYGSFLLVAFTITTSIGALIKAINAEMYTPVGKLFDVGTEGLGGRLGSRNMHILCEVRRRASEPREQKRGAKRRVFLLRYVASRCSPSVSSSFL